jgi:DNA-binding winged helix-turn-helix (wHTH) protein/tetratricopeptide (TPR) repeat protein
MLLREAARSAVTLRTPSALGGAGPDPVGSLRSPQRREAVLHFAGFALDGRRAELRGPGGEVVKLRRKSLELLELFASNAGQVLGKQEIIDAVWPKVHVGEDGLYQCVREIRAALGDHDRQLVKLVFGRGYLFDAEVVGAPEEPVAPSVDTTLPPDSAASAVESGPGSPGPPRAVMGGRRAAALAVGAALGAAGLALAAPLLAPRTPPGKPVIAVTRIVAASQDEDVARAAADLTERLTDGLGGIPNVRVLAPASAHANAGRADPAARADFVLRGEVQRSGAAWSAQVRMIRVSTGEVQWSASHSVAGPDADRALAQSRLVAGIGHPVATRISALVHAGPRADADVVIDQALAFINRTSRENFATAQAMLEQALAADPENIDLQAALSAHLLRGIQTAWYGAEEGAAAQRRARDLLENAIRAEPDYLPVLQGWCRYLTATNAFVESLVACAKAMKFDPWNGLVMYHVGLSQLQLGRFEDALATFVQADRADVPQVSRWTWLLGAGLACLMLDRDEEAVAWLQRSLAVTPGTGRTHFALAAAYQRLGRTQAAKEAIAEGLKRRPGSTADNIRLETRNASPVYLSRTQEISSALLAAGMPRD